jgi:hypothetical protein
MSYGRRAVLPAGDALAGIPGWTADTAGDAVQPVRLDGQLRSLAAAVAGGAQVGISGPFQVGPTMYWISPMSDPFTYMPSLVLATTLPGDANLDSTVNINDLSKVLTNYDRTGMIWTDGDFDGNGTVNINDLSKVLTNYDKTAGAAGAGVKAVPEPSTLLLIAAGLAGLLLAYAWRAQR